MENQVLMLAFNELLSQIMPTVEDRDEDALWRDVFARAFTDLSTCVTVIEASEIAEKAVEAYRKRKQRSSLEAHEAAIVLNAREGDITLVLPKRIGDVEAEAINELKPIKMLRALYALMGEEHETLMGLIEEKMAAVEAGEKVPDAEGPA